MHDIIIIGGGAAGLSAALYAARYGLDTVILEGVYPGGQIATAAEVANYPGILSTTGFQLAEEMIKQAKANDVRIITENVTDVAFATDVKTVATAKGKYEARSCIIATGRRPRGLGLPGENELRGKGISYCATCDGNFFRGKEVAIVGGGDTAITEAAFLSRICSKVYLIHRRDTFRAAKTEVDRLINEGRGQINLRMASQVTRLIGEAVLQGIEITGLHNGNTERLPVSALFIAAGNLPNSALFEGKVDMDSNGYITTTEEMATNIPGVFAAGDIRQKPLYQAVTAAADGAIAAYAAERFLEKTS